MGTKAPDRPIDTPGLAPLLVDAREAARLCGVGRTTWLSLRAQGRTPPSILLGRRRLWRVEEIRAWTAAGVPPAERWEWPGEGGTG